MDAKRRQTLLSLASLGVPGALALTGAQAQAVDFPLGRNVPPPELAMWPDARLHGEIRFRYWGFHAYDAQLWVRPGFDAQRHMASPFALCLTYARQLDALAISERAIEEIERQTRVTPELEKRWMGLLMKSMATVQPGDRLTGVNLPPDRANFFHNARPTAEMADATLVPLFFGIWLSPQTSQPGMRKALLKGPQTLARGEAG